MSLSTGISYVLVLGTIVVSDSKVLKDTNPGQSIRYPVEEKSRFEPSNKKQWLSTFTIDTGGARPTPYEDILDDDANLNLPHKSPLEGGQPVKFAGGSDWFASEAEARFSADLDTHFHGNGHDH